MRFGFTLAHEPASHLPVSGNPGVDSELPNKRHRGDISNLDCHIEILGRGESQVAKSHAGELGLVQSEPGEQLLDDRAVTAIRLLGFGEVVTASASLSAARSE
jgi:hypothetical protein